MRIYAYPTGPGNIRFVAAPSLKAAKVSGPGRGDARLATRSELEAALAQSMMVPRVKRGGVGNDFASAGDFL